ncbi:MAG: hypothetical protein U0641_16570 [Anaerolineae bacterium]
MNTRVQTIVEASRALSALEKIELIQAISRDLHEDYALDLATAEFWQAHLLEDIERTQATQVVTDIRALIADFWPTQESADDINHYVAHTRLVDRDGNA